MEEELGGEGKTSCDIVIFIFKECCRGVKATKLIH